MEHYKIFKLLNKCNISKYATKMDQSKCIKQIYQVVNIMLTKI